ncbi:hypothetical protein [Lactobacillus delbrueckii]|uniref:hypothetical protein n=1 Tax=Lactobacillus delbrueckii TaxID=1584 RepID=UPI00355BEFCF
MRRFALCMMTSAALMAGLASQVQASSKDYSKSTKTDLVTKIMGNKSYQVYSSLKLEEVTKKVKTKSKGKKKYTVKKKKEWKFGKKLAASADFRYAHVQSKSYKVKGGKRYYYIYVDGRPVGYVNEKAFALSKANVVSQVSLVNNALNTNGFVTTDAINYLTDKHGSVVDVNSVKRSADRISEKAPGRYVVTYRYGKASGKVAVTVRSDVNEGISKADAKLGKGQCWQDLVLA